MNTKVQITQIDTDTEKFEDMGIGGLKFDVECPFADASVSVIGDHQYYRIDGNKPIGSDSDLRYLYGLRGVETAGRSSRHRIILGVANNKFFKDDCYKKELCLQIVKYFRERKTNKPKHKVKSTFEKDLDSFMCEVHDMVQKHVVGKNKSITCS
jgi:hypothetical protein